MQRRGTRILARLLLPIFALVLPIGFSQTGMYGPANGHPTAGETAPDLVFSQLLHAPVPGSWAQANLSGQVTVLGFFPDTSYNRQPVADWNAHVDQFADKHLRFSGSPVKSRVASARTHAAPT